VTTASSEPDRPTITSTDVGDQEISLFLTVASDGGLPITGYDAVCVDPADPTELFTSSSATPVVVVSGLVNGTSYSCAVSASNALGVSPVSPSVGPIVPEPMLSQGLPLWLLIEVSNSP
jgi:titin